MCKEIGLSMNIEKEKMMSPENTVLKVGRKYRTIHLNTLKPDKENQTAKTCNHVQLITVTRKLRNEKYI